MPQSSVDAYTASASGAAADACAALLPPEARLIFDAVAPSITTNAET
jgi:hypothetical protein